MVAQILVIILLSASEFTVTPCHMTKRNAVKIKKNLAHSMIYCLSAVHMHTHTLAYIR